MLSHAANARAADLSPLVRLVAVRVLLMVFNCVLCGKQIKGTKRAL